MLIMPGCGPKKTGSPVYYQSNTEDRSRSPVAFVSDTLLMARIKSKFTSDDMVDDDDIHVKVRHGVVYLDGWVADAYQRRIVLDLVKSIDGVGRVVSRLQLTNPGTVFLKPEIRTPVF
ncbi:MAG: BON domain-containing protein [Desulfobacterales bacterium]|nr:BON domain-containing protein [Desulfobacterales bacterium]